MYIILRIFVVYPEITYYCFRSFAMQWVRLCAIFASLIVGCGHWFPRTPEASFYRLHRGSLTVSRARRCRTDVLQCGRRFPGRASCRLVLYRETGAAWLMPSGQQGRFRYCRCLAGWSGSRCQHSAVSPPSAARSPRLAGGACRGRPCGPGWRCAEDPSLPAGFSCGCDRRPGYRPASDTDPSCVPVDPCAEHGPCRHGGTCLSLGRDYRCQCSPAWSGRSCEAPLNPCREAELCTAGWTCRREPRARAGYSCGCDEKPGWVPRSEEDPQCVLRDTCLARSPCLNGGTCVTGPEGGFTCRCSAAWQGDTCKKPRDPCRTGNPCGATWKCRRDPDSPAGFTCDCASRPGWAAKSEEDPRCTVHDPCLTGSPCQNGGSCQYLSPGAYQCQCRPAWTGRTCEAPRDPCVAETCGPGWRCRRDPSSAVGYKCGCDRRPGWAAASSSDPRCVLVEPCRAKAPCGNGGTCMPMMEDGEPGYRCQCPPAWGGPVCSDQRNPCAAGEARCGAGWSCRRDESSGVGFSCGCEARHGWRPRSLQDPTCVQADLCRVRRPCRNGGRCGPGTATEPFTCRCSGGWQGTLCQQPRDPCRLGSPCGPQDTCRRSTVSRPGYSCHCELRPGYRARSASDPRCVLDNACLAMTPCLHSGSCTPGRAGKHSFTCTCTAAWSGDRCEIPRDPCIQEPEMVAKFCGAGSGCMRDPSSESGFACDCDARPGWRRRLPSDPRCVVQDACLALRPCRHGGTCRNVADQPEGFYRCFCHPAWTGRNCSQPLDPCQDPKNVCNTGFRCRRNVDSLLGFSCGCSEKPGYRASSSSNPECEVYDTCLAKEPCANGGSCSPVGEKNYFCECKKSWTGKTCEIVLVPCEGMNNTCGSRWRCHVDSKQPLGFTCGCTSRPGWMAAEDGHCVVADACLAYAPCANGGTCSTEGGIQYSCRCRAGWGGTTCEAPVDPCADGELCGASFTCRRDVQSSTGFSCDCERRPGWRRTSEDDPRCSLYDICLADPPCTAGGRCLSLGGANFRCVCPPDRRGRLCEEPVTTPAPPAPPPLPLPVLLPEQSSSPAPEEEDEEEPEGILRQPPAFKPVPETPVLDGFRRFLDELAVIAPKLKYVFLLIGLLIALVLLFLVCFVCCRRLCRARRRDKECEYLLKKAEMDRRCEQYLQAKYGPCDPCEPYGPYEPYPCEPQPYPGDEPYWDVPEQQPQPYRAPAEYVPELSSDESSIESTFATLEASLRGAAAGLRSLYRRVLGGQEEEKRRTGGRSASERTGRGDQRRSAAATRSDRDRQRSDEDTDHRRRRRRQRRKRKQPYLPSSPRQPSSQTRSASSGVSSMSEGSESSDSSDSCCSSETGTVPPPPPSAAAQPYDRDGTEHSRRRSSERQYGPTGHHGSLATGPVSTAGSPPGHPVAVAAAADSAARPARLRQPGGAAAINGPAAAAARYHRERDADDRTGSRGTAAGTGVGSSSDAFQGDVKGEAVDSRLAGVFSGGPRMPDTRGELRDSQIRAIAAGRTVSAPLVTEEAAAVSRSRIPSIVVEDELSHPRYPEQAGSWATPDSQQGSAQAEGELWYSGRTRSSSQWDRPVERSSQTVSQYPEKAWPPETHSFQQNRRPPDQASSMESGHYWQCGSQTAQTQNGDERRSRTVFPPHSKTERPSMTYFGAAPGSTGAEFDATAQYNGRLPRSIQSAVSHTTNHWAGSTTFSPSATAHTSSEATPTLGARPSPSRSARMEPPPPPADHPLWRSPLASWEELQQVDHKFTARQGQTETWDAPAPHAQETRAERHPSGVGATRDMKGHDPVTYAAGEMQDDRNVRGARCRNVTGYRGDESRTGEDDQDWRVANTLVDVPRHMSGVPKSRSGAIDETLNRLVSPDSHSNAHRISSDAPRTFEEVNSFWQGKGNQRVPAGWPNGGFVSDNELKCEPAWGLQRGSSQLAANDGEVFSAGSARSVGVEGERAGERQDADRSRADSNSAGGGYMAAQGTEYEDWAQNYSYPLRNEMENMERKYDYMEPSGKTGKVFEVESSLKWHPSIPVQGMSLSCTDNALGKIISNDEVNNVFDNSAPGRGKHPVSNVTHEQHMEQQSSVMATDSNNIRKGISSRQGFGTALSRSYTDQPGKPPVIPRRCSSLESTVRRLGPSASRIRTVSVHGSETGSVGAEISSCSPVTTRSSLYPLGGRSRSRSRGGSRSRSRSLSVATPDRLTLVSYDGHLPGGPSPAVSAANGASCQDAPHPTAAAPDTKDCRGANLDAGRPGTRAVTRCGHQPVTGGRLSHPGRPQARPVILPDPDRQNVDDRYDF